jgi:tetratricopeptide (TPR) repeat protein
MKRLLFCLLTLGCFCSFAQRSEISPIRIMEEADQLINNYQFERALGLLSDPGDSLTVAVIQRKGYCYLRLGNYVEAISQFERIVKIDSINPNALVQLGQLYAKNNQYEKARACYQKLIEGDSLNSYYYKQYASVAAQSNDVIGSVMNYLKAVRLNPKDVESYILLGNVLLEAEQYPLADTILNQALQIHKSPQLRLLLAKAQFGEERYEDVIRTTEQLMTKGDTIPAYARLLGISYFQLDRHQEVIPWMKFLMKSGQQAEWIYYYMGVSYQQLNMPDTAISYLNKAIEKGISDNISTYYTQLAMSYENIKDFKSAIRYYKAAYESSKSNILLYHLARNYDVYYKDKAQAIAYYKRYLNSDDTIKIAREYTRYRLDELTVLR